MNAQPTKLELAAPDRLRIAWSDGMVREYAVRELREKCPCATCREQRNAPPPPTTALPILSAAETAPLRIAAMNPVGRYAYGIGFSDGHDTGIFTLESLRELGAEVAPAVGGTPGTSSDGRG
jgi:DUF971 family protein